MSKQKMPSKEMQKLYPDVKMGKIKTLMLHENSTQLGLSTYGLATCIGIIFRSDTKISLAHYTELESDTDKIASHHKPDDEVFFCINKFFKSDDPYLTETEEVFKANFAKGRQNDLNNLTEALGIDHVYMNDCINVGTIDGVSTNAYVSISRDGTIKSDGIIIHGPKDRSTTPPVNINTTSTTRPTKQVKLW